MNNFSNGPLLETPRRFAISLFYFHFLCAPIAFSQRSASGLSTLSDVDLGFEPSGMCVGSAGRGRPTIAVVGENLAALNLYEISPAGSISQMLNFTTRSSFRSVLAADVNADGMSEYVALSSSGNSVSVIQQRNEQRGFEEMSIDLQSPVQRVSLADINADRRTDILLYGKNTAGVATLLRQADGSYKPGPILFQDISISDLAVVDFNGDRIPDVLLLNWLSNQLAVYYGVSRLVYAEQVSVQLPSQPEDLAITTFAGDPTFRVAVTLPEVKSVLVLSGSSIGDYRVVKTLELAGRPLDVTFTDMNLDNIDDIVTVTHLGISTIIGTSRNSFGAPVVFGAARSIAGWAVADVVGDGREDCVLVDRDTQRLVFLANSEYSPKGDMFEYCVGTGPQGLVVGDLNGNGWEDIGVVNSVSSSLSILLNRGKGRFFPQIAIPLTETPTHVRLALPSSGRERSIIAAHATDDKVSIIRLGDDLQQSKVLSIPTGTDPFVVFARRDVPHLQFLVRYQNQRDKSLLLSSFEQITPNQFVERSLRATLPTRITALNVDEVGGAGTYELIFLTNDKNTGESTLSFAVSDAEMRFKVTKPLCMFSDSTASTRMVFSAFVNGDNFKDVVLVAGSPRNSLGIWYGTSSWARRDTIEWHSNIQPANDDAIAAKDVDLDGVTDIVWLDAARKAVMVMYGTERAGFRRPIVVVPAEEAHSMRIGSFREQSVSDVVLSNPGRGTVTVVMNPFRR